jgi:hypothetical protein
MPKRDRCGAQFFPEGKWLECLRRLSRGRGRTHPATRVATRPAQANETCVGGYKRASRYPGDRRSARDGLTKCLPGPT